MPSPEQPVPPGEGGETLPLEAEVPTASETLRVAGGKAGEAQPGAETGALLGGIYDGARERDARLQAMGIIRDQGGRYLKASTNLDGTPGFVEVDPVEVERDVTQNIGTKISEAAIGELNLHMRAVVRKIGLNPTVFMSYTCAVSEKRFEEHLMCFGNPGVK